MVVGTFSSNVDVLVVGGGPGGYVAALRAAAAGKQTMLVERDALGGTCLNVGCIPSKALLHAAALAASGPHAQDWGIDMTPVVDMRRVQERIAAIVDRLTRGVGHLLSSANVDVREGTATFLSPTTARVVSGAGAASTVEFRDVIVATGSRPAALPSVPFDGSRVVDSTGLLALQTIPSNLVVIGGGYIGVEFGTAFAKLGSSVTIVEQEPTILGTIDRGLASVVTKAMARHGIVVSTGTTLTGVEEDAVSVTRDGRATAIPADVVLVSIGRRPNTDGIGLDRLGIPVAPDGFVEVDGARRAARTACAIGDITRGPGLAHKAIAEAEVAAKTVCGERATFDPACIPMVVFSDPEVASVGLTEPEASAAGISTKAFRFPLSASGRAMVAGDTTGHVQVVVDIESGLVVGVQLAGPSVSELAYSAALAIEMGATATDLAATIAPHPSMTEALVEAAAGADGAPLHVAAPRSHSVEGER